MGNIRDNKKKDVIHKRQHGFHIEHALFSFKHLTSNKHYSFDYFKKDSHNTAAAYKGFIDKMNSLSQMNMANLCIEKKETAFETIPCQKFKDPFQEILLNTDVVSKDSKLHVFRFKTKVKEYRFICKADINCNNVLYVIGFDFDFSAYDHG